MICRVPFTASSRECNSTRINNGFIISIKGTPELCHSKISSPSSFQFSLLSSVLASSKAVSSYNGKMVEVVTEAYQNTTPIGVTKVSFRLTKLMRKELSEALQ